MQPVALKAHTETSSVWCRTCARGGRDLVLYCFRPSVDSPSFAVGQHSVAGKGFGSIQHSSVVMGLIPMTPARCGLNSSPSHTLLLMELAWSSPPVTKVTPHGQARMV